MVEFDSVQEAYREGQEQAEVWVIFASPDKIEAVVSSWGGWFPPPTFDPDDPLADDTAAMFCRGFNVGVYQRVDVASPQTG